MTKNSQGSVRGVIFILMLGVFALVPTSVSLAQNAMITSVTEKETGKSVTLQKGEILEVTLPSNAGTGFTWRVKSGADSCLHATGDPKVRKVEADKKNGVGAAEYQIFQFETPAAGKAILELEYVRPWEKDKPPSKTFSLNVQVK